MNAWKPVFLALLLGGCASMSESPAELHVIAGGGIAAPLNQIATNFQKSSGHRLVIRYGTTPELIKMATSGDAFDLGVVPIDVEKNDAARARFAGAATEVARVGLGVAVRSGAPKPDISTPDALKKALLDARSIASIPASAAGTMLAGVYERLGITNDMKARIKPQPTPGAIVQSVASGEAELGVFLTNVLTAPGIDLVGPFPPRVNQELVYVTAISAHPEHGDAAKKFIAYLQGPDAAAVIKSKGMNPLSQRER